MFETGGFHKKVYLANSMHNADKMCREEFPTAQVVGVNLVPRENGNFVKQVIKSDLDIQYVEDSGYVVVLLPDTDKVLFFGHLLNSSKETYKDDVWSAYGETITNSLRVYGYDLKG